MIRKNSWLYVGDNTTIVQLAECKDQDGVVQQNASVQLLSLKDQETGLDVPEIASQMPITLTKVNETGLYRAVLPPAPTAFVKGRLYKAVMLAVGDQGYRGEWIETLVARERVA